ncbi:MAG: class I SAM-dependent methyltransferase [Lacunisphaera sp.]
MTALPQTPKSPLYLINRGLRRIRRGLYDLRAFVPGLSFDHKCERMIGPVGYWKELQQYQFNVLQANGLKAEHSLLDLGCGPLQGGIAFIRYLNTGKYTGVDLLAENVDAACRQVIRHHLVSKNPRLIQSAKFGDDFLAEASFDFIFVSQLLYLFDDATMAVLMAFIRRRLNAGGKFLGDIVNPEKHATVSAHYSSYIPHTFESIQRLARTEGLSVRSLGEIIQYQYPARLTLRQSLMLEFTKLA